MFAGVIESGRYLALQLDRHADISKVPPQQRMFSSEVAAWFKGARALVGEAFGVDSARYVRWKQLEETQAERIERRLASDTWDEVESGIESIGECVGLLTEFQLLLDARPGNVPEVSASLRRFRKDHPNPDSVGFLMMRFGSTSAHKKIVAGITEALGPFGMMALRADQKQYHDDLFWNILTYIHGCSLGIAVYERIEADEFNPNVALEVGYMLALHKPVCLLKDQTLTTLQVDLVGKLYRPFDPQDPEKTIPGALSSWLSDKGFVRRETPPNKRMEPARSRSRKRAAHS